MLGILLSLFIITLMVELFLLIEIGKVIGTLEVIGLTIATGIVCGILLLAPGILTDALGLLLLIPWTRFVLKRLLMRWIIYRIQKGQAHIHIDQHPWNRWN